MIELERTSTLSMTGATSLPITSARQWMELLAVTISRVLSPPVVTIAGICMVASHLAAPDTTSALTWALGECILVVLLPALFVVWLVARGKVADLDLRIRQQRMQPYLVTLICSLLAVAWTWLIGALPLFKLFALGAVVQIAILSIVTARWKISLHTAAIASLVVTALRFSGLGALPLLLCIPVVAWARLLLRRHDLAQTVAGALVGSLVYIVALSLSFPA